MRYLGAAFLLAAGGALVSLSSHFMADHHEYSSLAMGILWVLGLINLFLGGMIIGEKTR